MKIGILQTGHLPPEMAADHGNYPDIFARLLDGHGFDFVTWRAVDGDLPDGPEAADGWLITGSKHGAYEDLPWIAPLEGFIRDIVAADRPLIGVCFGHQIIAQALGGQVVKFEGGWSVGPKAYRFGNGERMIHAWHQDQVITVPEGAEVVASNDFCANAALLWPGKIYTVQPHPEFTDAFVSDLAQKRGPGVVPDGLLQTTKETLGTPLDCAQVAEEFATFFRTRVLTQPQGSVAESLS